jgi:hypothetical protein
MAVDFFQHQRQRREHLVIEEPQDVQSSALEKIVAIEVTLGMFWLKVLTTIELDNETVLMAIEVDDERAKRLLASELGS